MWNYLKRITGFGTVPLTYEEQVYLRKKKEVEIVYNEICNIRIRDCSVIFLKNVVPKTALRGFVNEVSVFEVDHIDYLNERMVLSGSSFSGMFLRNIMNFRPCSTRYLGDVNPVNEIGQSVRYFIQNGHHEVPNLLIHDEFVFRKWAVSYFGPMSIRILPETCRRVNSALVCQVLWCKDGVDQDYIMLIEKNNFVPLLKQTACVYR